MKVKKVNRYYCEFCKKSGCSGGHMKKHEERCTMNPNRVCGMCKMLDMEQPSMELMISLLPKQSDVLKDMGDWEYYAGAVLNAALPKLREAANNCPACIMAAIRQSGFPVHVMSDFNFTEECRSAWADFNNAHAEY